MKFKCDSGKKKESNKSIDFEDTSNSSTIESIQSNKSESIQSNESESIQSKNSESIQSNKSVDFTEASTIESIDNTTLIDENISDNDCDTSSQVLE